MSTPMLGYHRTHRFISPQSDNGREAARKRCQRYVSPTVAAELNALREKLGRLKDVQQRSSCYKSIARLVMASDPIFHS